MVHYFKNISPQGIFEKDFMTWATMNGFQKFYSPATVALPEGISINEYGWLDVPTSSELNIILDSIPPNEMRQLYWIAEKITSNSPSLVRASLEANTTWRDDIQDYDPDAWFTVDGFAISENKSENWFTLAPFLTGPGESLRIKVFPTSGNTGDFYFRFVAFEIKQ